MRLDQAIWGRRWQKEDKEKWDALETRDDDKIIGQIRLSFVDAQH